MRGLELDLIALFLTSTFTNQSQLPGKIGSETSKSEVGQKCQSRLLNLDESLKRLATCKILNFKQIL
jgi:hypothetical protein